MARERISSPRNFYLNESHELGVIDKAGGGRSPEYVGISWAQKSSRISASISKALQDATSSKDPLRGERYFVLAKPTSEIEKKSSDKRKAPSGTYKEKPVFGGAQGRVFDRLGLDLLQVTEDGDAVVHGTHERIEQLLNRSKSLQFLGAREQSRWVAIDRFDSIPLQLRVDGEWLHSLRADFPEDVVFELQPILGRVHADRVLRAISDLLAEKKGESLTGTGTDFSGRHWFRGKAAQASVRAIARDFLSVQAIHSPLFSLAAAQGKGAGRPAKQVVVQPPPPDVRKLPCVAVLDLGVPPDHVHLADYRRGQFTPQGAFASGDDHGSFVASRIVFGDTQSAEELAEASGKCSFYDVLVGEGFNNRVNDKVVLPALSGVRGAAPDIRVFNLSFGDVRPMAAFDGVEQREKRLELQDLDNFAFANDVLIVVAAGNSVGGSAPTSAYPNHHNDPNWALGPWACGFNTLVCGSHVSRLTADGLVKSIGYPSPFSRVGFGLCDAPVPSFCAEGGNSTASYNSAPGLGVWGYSGTGFAEDRIGTSHAAPLLAREAAFAFTALQRHCPPGARPFAVLVRAYLALKARRPNSDPFVANLVERTLGLGKTDADELNAPKRGTATILWQGIIETSKDVVRVQLPIPKTWLVEAELPTLRLSICYDPPVNEAATTLWACRKVGVTLHPGPESPGVRAPGRSHETYPLFFRQYSLARYAGGEKEVNGDLWLLELKYDEIFEYAAGMDFDPRQRVAVAAELFDAGDAQVDPQPAMQALSIASSLNRLSMVPTPIRTPIVIRNR